MRWMAAALFAVLLYIREYELVVYKYRHQLKFLKIKGCVIAKHTLPHQLFCNPAIRSWMAAKSFTSGFACAPGKSAFIIDFSFLAS